MATLETAIPLPSEVVYGTGLPASGETVDPVTRERDAARLKRGLRISVLALVAGFVLEMVVVGGVAFLLWRDQQHWDDLMATGARATALVVESRFVSGGSEGVDSYDVLVEFSDETEREHRVWLSRSHAGEEQIDIVYDRTDPTDAIAADEARPTLWPIFIPLVLAPVTLVVVIVVLGRRRTRLPDAMTADARHALVMRYTARQGLATKMVVGFWPPGGDPTATPPLATAPLYTNTGWPSATAAELVRVYGPFVKDGRVVVVGDRRASTFLGKLDVAPTTAPSPRHVARVQRKMTSAPVPTFGGAIVGGLPSTPPSSDGVGSPPGAPPPPTPTGWDADPSRPPWSSSTPTPDPLRAIPPLASQDANGQEVAMRVVLAVAVLIAALGVGVLLLL